ncbi:unnamed protein product, partial [Polarella glacialis]
APTPHVVPESVDMSLFMPWSSSAPKEARKSPSEASRKVSNRREPDSAAAASPASIGPLEPFGPSPASGRRVRWAESWGTDDQPLPASPASAWSWPA